MELGIRLSAVAGMVQTASVIADVGCDHGYLSVYLLEKGVCSHVIAMDVHKGPLNKALDTIRKCGYDSYIETRLSDGIDKLSLAEADGMICAGMGGALILRILWKDRAKVALMKQVVLQPQSELELFRRTLHEWGFVIEEENIVKEDEKFYPMMRVKPSQSFISASEPHLVEKRLSQYPRDNAAKATDLYSKQLLESKNECLKEFILKERKRLEKVFALLDCEKNNERTMQRRSQIESAIALHNWVLDYFY